MNEEELNQHLKEFYQQDRIHNTKFELAKKFEMFLDLYDSYITSADLKDVLAKEMANDCEYLNIEPTVEAIEDFIDAQYQKDIREEIEGWKENNI